MTMRILKTAAATASFILLANWLVESPLVGRPRLQEAFKVFTGFICVSALSYVLLLTWNVARVDADQLVDDAVERRQ